MWSHGGRRPRDESTDERMGGENNKSAILERHSFVRQRLSRPQRPPWPAPQSPSSCSIASHQSARCGRGRGQYRSLTRAWWSCGGVGRQRIEY
jgi:hypothetical protein